jgi:putative ABC transport system permease protein
MRDWRGLIGNRQLSPEAVDELAQHLEDTYQAALARGGDESAAMQAVHDELASLNQGRASLDIRTPRAGVLEGIRQFAHVDLRDAVRKLRRSPGFSALAIIVLAVGLGVNTAMFSLINALLYKPLPVKHPETLVFVYDVYPRQVPSIAVSDYEELASRKDLFSELAGFGGDRSGWAKIDGRLEQLVGAVITPNYLPMLGVSPQLGRSFNLSDDSATSAPVVLISDELWTTRFGRRDDALGKPLHLLSGQGGISERGRDYTIVGVLPAGFNGTGGSSNWLSPSYWVLPAPREADYICPARAAYPGYPWRPGVVPVGRLAEGVTLAQASSALRGWTPPSRKKLRDGEFIDVTTTRQSRLPYEITGQLVPNQVAAGLLVISGLVLIIAVSNLAGMFLARGVTSRGETAIRLSLGAGRWRVARHQMTTSLLLTFLGGVLALPVAALLTQALITNLPAQTGNGFGKVSVILSASLDGRALLFSAAACLIAGVIVGLPTARQASRTDVLESLQQASGSSTRSGRRLRHWIVVPQIGISLTLLLVTGAVARTIVTSELASPGYEPDGLVAVQFAIPEPDTCNVVGPATQIYKAVRDRYAALGTSIWHALPRIPTITDAALSGFQPYNMIGGGHVVTPESFARGQHYGVRSHAASPGFFQTMGIRFAAGRDFLPSETFSYSQSGAETGALIVSRRLADELWPGRQPIGQQLALHWPDSPAPKRWAEVVGVVDDVLPAINDGWAAPTVYIPANQGYDVSTIVARAKGPAGDAIRDLSRTVLAADPSAVVLRGSTFNQEIAEQRFTRRLAVTILGVAALIGLALAAIGLYGVISYSLAQRVREFGIRASLGANYRDLIVLVLREGLLVASVGSVLGFAAAYSAIGLISSKLVAIPSVNIAIVIAGPAIVFAAVALACYLPARRAAKVDPLIVLRGL